MGISVYCSCYNYNDQERLYIFSETSEGHFGNDVGSPSTATYCETTSTSSLRIVAVPKTITKYPCTSWYNQSSGSTATNYGLLTCTRSDSAINHNRCQASYVSSSGAGLTIIDEHGSHSGTPNQSSSDSTFRYPGGTVIGVKHLTTDAGWVFKGWSITFQRGSGSSFTQFLSTFSASEAVTSGNTTEVSESYSNSNAVVLQLGTYAYYFVTITALYDEATGPTYTITFYDNGNVFGTESGTSDSGIQLIQGPTPPTGYSFIGWTIDGTLYAEGTVFYPSGTNYSITANATYQQLSQRSLVYVSEYGTPPTSQQVPVGQTVILASATASMISVASQNGFQFDGWILDGESNLLQPGYSFPLSSNRTATAQFSRLPVTLKYYSGYPTQPGTLLQTVNNLTYGGSYILNAGPSRSGYSFIGWLVTDCGGESQRTYEGGATIILNDTSPNADSPHVEPITAIALWSSLTTYTIHYSKNASDVSGPDIPDVYVTEGNQVKVEDPLLWARSGYSFAIWESDNGKYFLPDNYLFPTSDTILLAIWDSNNVSGAKNNYRNSTGNPVYGKQIYSNSNNGYTICFSTNITTQNISLNYQIKNGEVGGYQYNGSRYRLYWERYHVIWDSSTGTYQLGTLDSSGYSGTTQSSSTTVNSIVDIDSDDVTESYVSPSTSTNISTPIGILEYSSCYVTQASSSYITYNYERYSVIGTGGTVYTAPEIQNYVFKGWYCINESIDNGSSATTVNKNLFTHKISSDRQITFSTLAGCNYIRTFYYSASGIVEASFAHLIRLVYEGVQVVIILDANGGTCEPCYKISRYGEEYGELPTPTNDGATFLGWFTSPSGGTQVTQSTIVQNPSEHSIYAHWSGGSSVLTYSVIFVDLSGTNNSVSQTFQRGVSTNLPLITSSNGLGWTLPTGYSLDTSNTWNTSPSLVGDFYANGQLVTDLTSFDSIYLYAAWKPQVLTITLNANGGTVSPSTLSVLYGSEYGSLPIPTYSGYNFLGWFTAYTGGTQIMSSSIATSSTTIYAHWETKTSVLWGYIEYPIVLETN